MHFLSFVQIERQKGGKYEEQEKLASDFNKYDMLVTKARMPAYWVFEVVGWHLPQGFPISQYFL